MVGSCWGIIGVLVVGSSFGKAGCWGWLFAQGFPFLGRALYTEERWVERWGGLGLAHKHPHVAVSTITFNYTPACKFASKTQGVVPPL